MKAKTLHSMFSINEVSLSKQANNKSLKIKPQHTLIQKAYVAL